MADMVAVFRAPMRSPRAEPTATIDRARRNGLVGFDGVETGEGPPDDRLTRRIARFAAIDDGAFVWTRDGAGLFWLGRIDGPYRYDPAGAAVGLVHIRPCRWLAEPVLEPEVPAAVQATFRRGGRNFQQTHHPTVSADSQRVWDAHGM